MHIKLGMIVPVKVKANNYLTSAKGKVNEEGDNLSEAVSEYEQALELRQAVLGPDHPLTIKVC